MESVATRSSAHGHRVKCTWAQGEVQMITWQSAHDQMAKCTWPLCIAAYFDSWHPQLKVWYAFALSQELAARLVSTNLAGLEEEKAGMLPRTAA